MLPLSYNARSLWARRFSTGANLVGLALVVFVFAAVLMLGNGIETALASGGSPATLVVLRDGADAELSSSVERDSVRVISAMPGIATAPGGAPLVAGELVVLVALPRGDGFANVTVRGVEPESLAARPGVRIVEGRMPVRGALELAIGRGLVGTSPDAYPGANLEIASQSFTIVGVLAADGGAYESELWGDARRIGEAFKRDAPSSVIVRATSPAAAAALARRIDADPRFTLKAKPEETYWADQSTGTATFIRVLGLFVSVVFSVGAVLGAMITMFAQVAARTRELGMIRAVGFRRRSVLASVLVESVLLGLAGGLLGAGAASAMRFVQIRTLNFQTFAEVRFGFAPTAQILLGAVAFGAVMGLVGGLVPALRAARLSIVDSLRA